MAIRIALRRAAVGLLAAAAVTVGTVSAAEALPAPVPSGPPAPTFTMGPQILSGANGGAVLDAGDGKVYGYRGVAPAPDDNYRIGWFRWTPGTGTPRLGSTPYTGRVVQASYYAGSTYLLFHNGSSLYLGQSTEAANPSFRAARLLTTHYTSGLGSTISVNSAGWTVVFTGPADYPGPHTTLFIVGDRPGQPSSPQTLAPLADHRQVAAAYSPRFANQHGAIDMLSFVMDGLANLVYLGPGHEADPQVDLVNTSGPALTTASVVGVSATASRIYLIWTSGQKLTETNVAYTVSGSEVDTNLDGWTTRELSSTATAPKVASSRNLVVVGYTRDSATSGPVADFGRPGTFDQWGFGTLPNPPSSLVDETSLNGKAIAIVQYEGEDWRLVSQAS